MYSVLLKGGHASPNKKKNKHIVTPMCLSTKRHVGLGLIRQKLTVSITRKYEVVVTRSGSSGFLIPS